MAEVTSFRPALLVVDMQEDFCPPNGSLAVEGGRDIAPVINELLELPFAMRVASQDWHPSHHQSFVRSHAPELRPFVDQTLMTNPENPSEMRESTVWPVHCVQNTFGAQIIPEINSVKLDVLVKKGMDARVEMYSAFADIFGNKSGATVDLPALLREKAITHVYVVGLAGDHCVRCTALDARKEGFSTFVVQDATRSVDETKGWSTAVKEFKEAGISVIDSTSPEIERIKALSRP